ncbi:hypothetical protein [Chitinophaga sp. Cy-1792]|uniref:hypothetical protein n=1 Tax=Chitinophaga sp. Cy-1792 TaxID=2608339 RepID=UPI00141F1348|nr:hypothetical protein [Chitinophaga sp. Cy-1792]NIG56913.1 hypothetical protein [Chitinophaga sp. Cy-1792]
MEKIYALIEKLQELRYSGADLQTISYYVQMLQAEVLHARNRQHQQQAQQQVQSALGQIAVIMPARHEPLVTVPEPAVQTTTSLPNKPELTETNMPFKEMPVVSLEEPKVTEPLAVPQSTVNNIHQPEPVISAPQQYVPQPLIPEAPKEEPVSQPLYQEPPVQPFTPVAAPAAPKFQEPAPVPAPAAPMPAPAPIQEPLFHQPAAAAPKPVQEKPQPATLFDAVEPNTAPIQPEVKSQVTSQAGTSLNERLAAQQMELGQKLGQQRISDIRNAIGINDKYQFIQELFHGDNIMYERSLKTLNDFHSLQEADLWIQREIKIIHGWQDEHPLVQQFYTVLKKRFS